MSGQRVRVHILCLERNAEASQSEEIRQSRISTIKEAAGANEEPHKIQYQKEMCQRLLDTYNRCPKLANHGARMYTIYE